VNYRNEKLINISHCTHFLTDDELEPSIISQSINEIRSPVNH